MSFCRQKHIFPFLIFLIFFLPFIFTPKAQSLLFINGLTSEVNDFFFRNITWLGEGFLIFFFVLILPFIKSKWVYVFLLSVIIHIFLIQINKQYLFNHLYRPYTYMEWIGKRHLLHLVEGVKIRTEVSFPSGHTTNAAFTCLFISLVFKKKSLSWILAFLAFTIGISRVYLVQHFFIDIYFGFLFGVFSTTVSYILITKLIEKRQWQWMDNSLITLRNRQLKLRVFRVKRVLREVVQSFF